MTDAEFSDLLTRFSQDPHSVDESIAGIADFESFFYAARRAINRKIFEEAKSVEAFVQAVASHTGQPEHWAFVHWCQGILYRIRQPQRSLEHTIQAVDYFQSTGQTEYEGRTLIGCAYQRSLMGDLAQAKADLLRAIECLASLPDYPQWPVVYINLANTLIMQGDFAGAIANAKKADDEAQRLSTLLSEVVFHSMRAQALNNQALAILFQGHLSEAERLFEAALEQALLGDSPEDAGRAELSLVHIAMEKGEIFSPLKRLHSAKHHFKEAQADLELATAAIEEANLYEKLALPERALEAALLAAQAFVEAGIPAGSMEAYLIGARLALAHHLYSKARTFLAEAQKYLDKAPPLHQARWLGYYAHPQLQNSVADKHEALHTAQEAENQLRHLGAVSEALEIGLIAAELSSELRLPDATLRFGQIAEVAKQHGMNLIELTACKKLAALQPARLAVPIWQRVVRLATDMRSQMPAEELKARLFTHHIDSYVYLIEAQLKSDQPREAAASLLEAKGGIWLDLAAPAYAVDPSADRLNAKFTLDFLREEQLNALTPEYREFCERQIEEAEIGLIEASRQQARLRQPLPTLTIEQIQADLPPRTCLIEYLVGTTHIWCCLIHADEDIQWKQLCKRNEIENALQHLAGIIRTLERPSTLEQRLRLAQGTQPQANLILKKLYDLLLAPLTRSWSDNSLLVIVPDGRLYDIPWAALHDGDAYLSEYHTITLLPSSVFVIKGNSKSSFTNTTRQDTPYLFGYAGEPPLKFLDSELQTIQAVLPNAIVHNPASSQAIQSVVTPQILHIAAHGESNPVMPLLSYLELADGKFYLHDILNLNLHGTQLVTLSGYETGRIPSKGGALFSVPGAFLCAGTRMTLASLWLIDDEATQGLMRYFYRQLRIGTTPAQALQHAQWEIRKAGYVHPFYWAAFQPLGRTL